MIDPIEKSDPDIDQRPFEIEVLAARYRAERDLAIQERERLEKEVGLLRDAEHERDMLRDLADVLVVKAIERPCVRTFAEGLDDAEINDRIDSIIDAIDRRLMPPGMEWPRYEDNEPVRLGDEFTDHDGLLRKVAKVCLMDDGYYLVSKTGTYYLRTYRQRVKRPTVLAADGEKLKVGQTVWEVGTEAATPMTVIDVDHDLARCEYTWTDGKVRRPCLPPDRLTHRVPILAADGRPLREGEHVYHVDTGTELVVKALPKPGEYQAVIVFALPTSPASHLTSFDPDQLTHERPDTWERLKADIYREIEKARSKSLAEMFVDDLVRRAKALAGEGR